MKFSLGSWVFSFGPFADNTVPFEKTVRSLSEAGYDGIEICGLAAQAVAA
jgi:sugar phosphate isomerase/epimerase